MPVNSKFSGAKHESWLSVTFPDFGWLSRNNPSPLTQIFGKAFAERGWETVRGIFDPSLTLHWPLTQQSSRSLQGTQRELTNRLLLARCYSVGSKLWFRKERTASPSGTDWHWLLVLHSEGWGKGEWGAKSTHHPPSRPFYKGVSSIFSEGWGVFWQNQGTFVERIKKNKDLTSTMYCAANKKRWADVWSAHFFS